MRQINAEAVIEAVKADLEAEDRIDLLEWLVGEEEWNVVSFRSYVSGLIEAVERQHQAPTQETDLSFPGFLATLPPEERRAAERDGKARRVYMNIGEYSQAAYIEQAQKRGGTLYVWFGVDSPINKKTFNSMTGQTQDKWQKKQERAGLSPEGFLTWDEGESTRFALDKVGLAYALYRQIPIKEVNFDMNFLEPSVQIKLKARARQDYPHLFAAAHS